MTAPFVQGREDALCSQRQVYPLAAPGRRALPQGVERQFAGRRRGWRRGAQFLGGAQHVEHRLHEIALGEVAFLQVVPGIERLHDAAVDAGRHAGHDEHRRRAALVDFIDDGDTGVAFAAELYVEYDEVVALAVECRDRLVAIEPLVDHDSRARGLDPAPQLGAGRHVVFDYRNPGPCCFPSPVPRSCPADRPVAGPSIIGGPAPRACEFFFRTGKAVTRRRR